MMIFFFFFSSRRRHTRCLSDWSSDVCSSDLGGLEQLPEVVMDGALVINDEDTAIVRHQLATTPAERETSRPVESMGNSRTNVAPVPGPSLRAHSDPPIRPAARADVCRPNPPCPPILLVNPNSKIRSMCSRRMPTPLSRTCHRTVASGASPQLTDTSIVGLA